MGWIARHRLFADRRSLLSQLSLDFWKHCVSRTAWHRGKGTSSDARLAFLDTMGSLRPLRSILCLDISRRLVGVCRHILRRRRRGVLTLGVGLGWLGRAPGPFLLVDFSCAATCRGTARAITDVLGRVGVPSSEVRVRPLVCFLPCTISDLPDVCILPRLWFPPGGTLVIIRPRETRASLCGTSPRSRIPAASGVGKRDANAAPAFSTHESALCTTQLLERLAQGLEHDLLGSAMGEVDTAGAGGNIGEKRRRNSELWPTMRTSLLS